MSIAATKNAITIAYFLLFLRSSLWTIPALDNNVIATASTTEAAVKKLLKNTSNKEAAIAIGKRIAEKAVKAGVKKIAFDRSGYKYHGRIKALAESARENGLTF